GSGRRPSVLLRLFGVVVLGLRLVGRLLEPEVLARGLLDRVAVGVRRAELLLGELALLLARVHAGGALVDRVPALDLVAEDVDVVVQRLGRRELRLVRETDGLVDALDHGPTPLLASALPQE